MKERLSSQNLEKKQVHTSPWVLLCQTRGLKANSKDPTTAKIKFRSLVYEVERVPHLFPA